MPKIVTTLALAAIAGIGLSGSAPAATPPVRNVLPPPLLPLSDDDTASASGTGCQFTFSQGRDSFVFAIANDFLIRTAPGKAGLQHCAITDAQFNGFGDGPTEVSCGGRRLSVRHAGKTTDNEAADSSGGPAILTMTDGTHTRSVRGDWGTAC